MFDETYQYETHQFIIFEKYRMVIATCSTVERQKIFAADSMPAPCFKVQRFTLTVMRSKKAGIHIKKTTALS